MSTKTLPSISQTLWVESETELTLHLPFQPLLFLTWTQGLGSLSLSKWSRVRLGLGGGNTLLPEKPVLGGHTWLTTKQHLGFQFVTMVMGVQKPLPLP